MRRGLAFDAFGRTEDLARQAAATVLAMFTISGALSVPRKNVGKMAVNLEKMGKTGAEYGNDRKSVGKTVGKHISGKHAGNIWETYGKN
jgi:hypothetical protein